MAVLLLIVFGLGIHAIMDGFALGFPAHAEANTPHLLPWAVVLHRIPAGMVIWWLVRPNHGIRRAVFALGIVVLGTLVGYWGSEHLEVMEHSRAVAFVTALVAGSLLHVVVHHHGHPLGCDHEDHDGHHGHESKDGPAGRVG